MRWRLFTLFTLVCLPGIYVWPQTAPAATTAQPIEEIGSNSPAEVLKRAAEVNGLESDTVSPWHLKATFQLYDPSGKPSEQGTYEEFWASEHKYKRIYTSPSFTQTEWATEDGKFFRSGRAYLPPPIISLIRSQLVVRMPTAKSRSDAVLTGFEETIGTVKLSCVSLTQSIKGIAAPPNQMFPTYCIDRANAVLRVSRSIGGIQSIANEIVLFQNRYVPKIVRVSSYNKPLLEVRLESLTGLASASITEFHPPDDAVQVNVQGDPLDSKAPRVTAGEQLRKVAPLYPADAKRRHVEGIVVMRGTIGTDGHVGDLSVLSAPDALLAEAAVDAVRQWAYRPYLLDGIQVEVVTSFTVMFRLQ